MPLASVPLRFHSCCSLLSAAEQKPAADERPDNGSNQFIQL